MRAGVMGVIDFMREHLTCADDADVCLDYIYSAGLTAEQEEAMVLLLTHWVFVCYFAPHEEAPVPREVAGRAAMVERAVAVVEPEDRRCFPVGFSWRAARR